MCLLFFLCVLLLPKKRRNNLQEVIAISRPKFAYEIVENDLNSNQISAKNESEIQKGVVLRALPDFGEVIMYLLTDLVGTYYL